MAKGSRQMGLDEQTGDQMTNLPHLLLSSIEFCFSTQASELQMPYDLKIAQCLVGMHQFMASKIF